MGGLLPRLLARKAVVELHLLEPRRFPALDKDNHKWKVADRQAGSQGNRMKIRLSPSTPVTARNKLSLELCC